MRVRIESPDAETEAYSCDVHRLPIPHAHRLDVRVLRQTQSNWCWVAVAASVARFYGSALWTERSLAQAVLGPELPDRTALLRDALIRAGCYSHWSPGRPSFLRIAGELASGRPVAALVAWNRGGTHYVLVTGYDTGAHRIWVADPLYGISLQPFASFPSAYHHGGTWRETIWTWPTGPSVVCG